MENAEQIINSESTIQNITENVNKIESSTETNVLKVDLGQGGEEIALVSVSESPNPKDTASPEKDSAITDEHNKEIKIEKNPNKEHPLTQSLECTQTEAIENAENILKNEQNTENVEKLATKSAHNLAIDENVEEIVLPDPADDLIIPNVEIPVIDVSQDELNPNQCRICMTMTNLVSIFQFDDDKNLRICDMIMKLCGKIRISERDYLPHFVCEDCVDRIVLAYELVLQCVKTDGELRSKLPRRQKKARTVSEFVTIDYVESSSDSNDEEPKDDDEFYVSEASLQSEVDSDVSSSSTNSKKKRTPMKRRQPQKKSTRSSKRKRSNVSNETDSHTVKIKSEKLESSSDTRDKKPTKFICPTCLNSFQNQSALTNHQKTHNKTNKKKFGCNQCDENFPSNSHLQKHIVVEHQTMSVKCTTCWRTFSGAKYLKQHQMSKNCLANAVATTKIKTTPTPTSSSRASTVATVATVAKRNHHANNNPTGRDLFKAVAPLTTTYWSDSFSD